MSLLTQVNACDVTPEKSEVFAAVGTMRAHVGFLVRMAFYVNPDGPRLGTTVRANGTLVRSFPCVFPHVDSDVGRGFETVPANGTGIWLFSCVDSYVPSEMTQKSSRVVAMVTRVRFVASVFVHVHFEGAGQDTIEIAFITGVGLFFRVQQCMPLQVLLSREHLMTSRAFVGFLTCM